MGQLSELSELSENELVQLSEMWAVCCSLPVREEFVLSVTCMYRSLR
jgi:hypothetical protein